ncbi:hypothetical protein BGZ63DRAFT_371624 [Mariannaea sp. PMI_226]|nr:hypothetical protein BGZ63DRAFT_371624 [Mariannaea sp. PMI_226]
MDAGPHHMEKVVEFGCLYYLRIQTKWAWSVSTSIPMIYYSTLYLAHGFYEGIVCSRCYALYRVEKIYSVIAWLGAVGMCVFGWLQA